MNRTSVVRYVSSLPIGEYRATIGAIRRAWKSKQTGKPVKRVRRTIRMSSEDVRWAQDVKERDRFTCRMCGAGKITGASVESAHIVPRRYLATKRLVINGLTLCRPCHRWAHSQEYDFLWWAAEQIGLTATSRLRLLTPAWKGWNALQIDSPGGER